MMRLLRLVACGYFALFLSGCGSGSASGSGSGTSSTQSPAIATQPTSQIVPIDRAATFTVTATGTQPLRYQWSRNGQAIPGATGSSYTTPLVALTDSGSTFQVTVSNSSGSVTSNAAALTAGARAPAIGDVRYLLWQQVTIPWANGADGNDLGANEYSYAHALGTPLVMGGNCDWPFSVLYLPPTMNGFAMYYQQDFYSEGGTPYASWLQSVSTPNIVITSVDLEESSLCRDIAASWVATAPPGQFDLRLEEVAAGQVQATVAADGAEGRIVTAATFDDAAGEVVLISYGWQGDTTTVYEAQTVVTTPQAVINQAFNLGNAGYFISAFGGNHTDGYLLIGMRVRGDTLPREITNNSQTFGTAPKDSAYGSVVAWFGDAGVGATIYEQ